MGVRREAGHGLIDEGVEVPSVDHRGSTVE